LDYSEFITNDMTRRIYNELLENTKGQLPYPDFKLNYILNKRGDKGEPLEVELEIVDEESKNVKERYFLLYKDGFSDYRIIQGNQQIKN